MVSNRRQTWLGLLQLHRISAAIKPAICFASDDGILGVRSVAQIYKLASSKKIKMAASDFGLSQMFAGLEQPRKHKMKPKHNFTNDVLLQNQILNVLPKQFDEILGLRADYYKYLDSILLHYHIVPVLVWVLRAAHDIISNISDRASSEPDERMLRKMLHKLDKLMFQQQKPKVETTYSAVTENEDTEAIKARAIRRDLGELPDSDKWIQSIDVIDAILHIRVPGSMGTYFTRYNQPNPPSLQHAITLDELQRVRHLSHELLTFEPSDEWSLMNALDVTPTYASASNKSKPVDIEHEKNQLQLSSFTLGGMQKIVENARLEADKYRVLARELMVKLTQCVELVASLVETKQAAPVYLTVLNAYIDYAAPHMSAKPIV